MSELWPADLSLGVPAMDADHSRLAHLIARFEKAATEAGGSSQAHAVLLELIEAASEHFLKEQDEMRGSGYPSFEAHVQEHNRLLDRILSLGEDRELWREAAGGALRVWLTDHIRTADHAFAVYLLAGEENDRIA